MSFETTKIMMPNHIRKEFNYITLASVDNGNYYFSTEDCNYFIHYNMPNNEWEIVELAYEHLTEEELKNDGRLQVPEVEEGIET